MVRGFRLLRVFCCEAIAERNRPPWHLHADETTWWVFTPHDGMARRNDGLWVFLGPDTVWAGDTNPGQLKYWTRKWLDGITARIDM
jgi:hypothetical protein